MQRNIVAWLAGSMALCCIAITSLGQEVLVKERGAHHRVVENVVQATDATGQPTTVTNTYTELEIGLHFQNAQGEWVEASDELEIVNGKAIGNQAQHQVTFEPNIATSGAITLVTPEGQILRSHVLGLSYFDPTTGQSVLIAEVKDSIGEVHGHNQVIYHDAFDDVAADIRYTFTKAGFEQDVILRAAPPAPETYGLNPATVQLQVLTEFLQPPTPEREDKVIDVGTNGVPTMYDVALNFGTMQIGRGRAFTTEDDISDGSLPSQRETGVPVGKEWGQLEGRDFLIESVSYPSIETEVEALPANTNDEASLKPVTTRRVVSATRQLPVREASAGLGGSIRAVQAKLITRPGLVIDYATVNSISNYVFQGDSTYYVSNSVSISGNIILEGGSVIKYAVNGQIRILGILECLTDAYRPAIFTAKDDNTVGETINGSTGTPSGYYADSALFLDSTPTDLRHIRVVYAKKAITYDSDSGGVHYLWHSQLINCGNGILPYNAKFHVRNVLMQDVEVCFTNQFLATQGQIEHLTVHRLNNSVAVLNGASSTVTLKLTNSILAGITTFGTYSGANNETPTTAAGVFLDVGAGMSYLANGTYRNLGTTAITPGLLEDLQHKTTYPPTVVAGSVINLPAKMSMDERVPRDTDVPDLGYHYSALDYAITDVAITNTTLTLTNGVAIAVFGNHGFLLRPGSKLFSEGNPTNLNRIARYQAVQERPYVWGANSSTKYLMKIDQGSSSMTRPQVEFRFTELSVISLPSGHKGIFYDSQYTISPLTFAHCHLQGGSVQIYPTFDHLRTSVLSMTNNILERTTLSVHHNDSYYHVQSVASFYNNTFYGGFAYLNNDWVTYDSWRIQDNVFDRCAISSAGSNKPTSSNNGYVDCGPLSGATSNNVSVSNFAYWNGPLGRFYHQSSTFADLGSRTGTSASLYHYTTQRTQGRETSTTVDLGFHYPSVTLSNLALAKMTTQSSDYTSGHTATNGVDGNRTSAFAHTLSSDTNAWWQVDLGEIKKLEAIWIWNRTDQFSNRLSNFYIFISDNAFSSNDPSVTAGQSGVKSFFYTQSAGSPGTYQIRQSGRYVRIQQTSTGKPLNIHELEVYGVLSVRDTDKDGAPDVMEDRNGNGATNTGETNYELADTDGDSVLDGEEIVEGFNPLQFDQSSKQLLGKWRFNGTPWLGDQGQIPATNGLSGVSTWEGQAVVVKSDALAKLIYPTAQADGQPNVALKRGSIRFWFKPDWKSSSIGGSGPGTGERYLIWYQTAAGATNPGSLRLAVSSTGNVITFQYKNSGAAWLNLAANSTPKHLQWASDRWCQVVVTYNSVGTYIYLDGELFAFGSPVPNSSSASGSDIGLAVGGDINISTPNRAEGAFELLETFNYPLSTQDIRDNYTAAMAVDTDGDGLSDVLEAGLGSDITGHDTDGDGMPDGWEVAYGLDPLIANSDKDLDGVSDFDEFRAGTNPIDGTVFPTPLITDYRLVKSPKNLINIDFVNTPKADERGVGVAGYSNDPSTGDYWNTIGYNVDSGIRWDGFGDLIKSANGEGLTNVHIADFSGPIVWRNQTALSQLQTELLSCLATYTPEVIRAYSCGPYINCVKQKLNLFGREAFSFFLGSVEYPIEMEIALNLFLPDYGCSAILLQGDFNLLLYRWISGGFSTNYSGAFDLGVVGEDSRGHGMYKDYIGSVFNNPDAWSTLLQGHLENAFSKNTYLVISGLPLGRYKVFTYNQGEVETYSHYSGGVKVFGAKNSTVRLAPWKSASWGGRAFYGEHDLSLSHWIASEGGDASRQSDGVLSGFNGVGLPIRIGVDSDIFDMIEENNEETRSVLSNPELALGGPSNIVITLTPPVALNGLQILKLSPLGAATVSTVQGIHAIHLHWTQVPETDDYLIYRKGPDDSVFKEIARTRSLFVTDANVLTGETNKYLYYVRANNTYELGPPSHIVQQWAQIGNMENFLPILNHISRMTGPFANTPFRMPYTRLLASSDASDMDQDTIYFRIEEVLSGSVTINDSEDPVPEDGCGEEREDWQNCLFGPNDKVIWTPPSNLNDETVEALRLRAYDGHGVSLGSAVLSLYIRPMNALVGWGDNSNGGLGNGTIHPMLKMPNGWEKYFGAEWEGEPGFSYARDNSVYMNLPPTKVKNVDRVTSFFGVGGLEPSLATDNEGKLWMWGLGNISGLFGASEREAFENLSYHWGMRIYDTPQKIQQEILEGEANVMVEMDNVVDAKIAVFDVGAAAAFALKGDGTLWSWGDSTGSNWGRDNKDPEYLYTSINPGRVEGLDNVIGFDTDGRSTVAWKNDGSVWWWGDMSFMYLDVYGVPQFESKYFLEDENSRNDRPNRLTFLDGDEKVVQVATSENYFLALKDDGTVWEFGYIPRDLIYYEGEGVMRGPIDFFIDTPKKVEGLEGVVSIAVSGQYSLALLADRSVKAWGAFVDGWKSYDPVTVPGLNNIVSISLSDRIGDNTAWSRAWALALDASGRVWGWGSNSRWVLGHEEEYGKIFPQPRLLPDLEEVEAIHAGTDVGLALATLRDEVPKGLVATGGNEQIRLDWRNYPGATKYYIKRSTGSSPDFQRIATSTHNWFIDRNVENGATYHYVVSAEVEGRTPPETGNSSVALGIPIPPPLPPLGFEMASSCKQAIIAWTPEPVAEEYKIYRAPAGGTPVFSLISRVSAQAVGNIGISNKVGIIDRGLAANDYTYRVIGVNSAGDGIPYTSAVLTVTADGCPDAPTGLTAIVGNQLDGSGDVVGSQKIVLNWNPVSGADSYIVKMRNVNTLQYMPFSTVLTTTWAISNIVENGKEYWFTVSAVTSGHESDNAVPVRAVPRCDCSPAIPEHLIAIAGQEQVYLRWEEDEKAQYYKVQYKVGSGSFSSPVIVYDNQFWHEGLVNGSTYTYQVKAYNGTDSDYSEISALPLASYPKRTGVTSLNLVAQPYDAKVHLSWVTHGTEGFIYFVERKVGSSEWERISEVNFGLSFSDSPLVNGTAYTYRVTGLDDFMHRYVSSEETVTPGIIDGLFLSATAGNSYVDLSWNELSNVKYTLKRAVRAGGPYSVIAQSLDAGVDEYKDLNVINGVIYYYTLTASDAVGDAVITPEVVAQPSANAAPGGINTNDFKVVFTPGFGLLSWTPAIGAAQYEVWVLVSGNYQLLGKTFGTTFEARIPSGTPDETLINYKIVALSSTGTANGGNPKNFTYDADSLADAPPEGSGTPGGTVELLKLPAEVTTPTNLVLNATVHGSSAVLEKVEFYAGAELIGIARDYPYQITWHNPTGGDPTNPTSGSRTYQLYARAVFTNDMSLNSTAHSLIVKWSSDILAYRTAVTDLSIPTPGLPLEIGRSYDSRNVGTPDPLLGYGWTPNWRGPKLVVLYDNDPVSDPNLHHGWKAGAANEFGSYSAVETESHVIRIEFPDGQVEQFSPALHFMQPGNPFDSESLGMVNMNFVPVADTFGQLSCQPSRGLDIYGGPGHFGEWAGEFSLVVDHEVIDTGEYFTPQSFTYLSSDQTSYTFKTLNGTWQLEQAEDINGNKIVYHYDTATPAKITELEYIAKDSTTNHSRKIGFTYPSGEIWVFDPIEMDKSSGSRKPVLKYGVQSNQLKKVLRQVTRGTDTYEEQVGYGYGTSGSGTSNYDLNRITSVYEYGNSTATGVKALAITYGPTGWMTRQTDARGDYVDYTVSSVGASFKITSSRVADGVTLTEEMTDYGNGLPATVKEAGATAETSFVYDEQGRPVVQIDPNQNSTSTAYDRRNRVTSQTDGEGNTTQVSYGAMDLPKSTTDAAGNATDYRYDERGNLKLVIDEVGNETTYAYNSQGLQTLESRPSGNSTDPLATITKYYDDYNSDSGIAATYAKDLDGDGQNEVTTTTGRAGDVYSVTDAATNTTYYAYDANGNRTLEVRTRTIRRMRSGVEKTGTEIFKTITTYDPQNRVVSTRHLAIERIEGANVTALDETSTVEYTQNGKQKATVNAASGRTEYTYDVRGNLIQTKYPDNRVSRTVYDGFGRVKYTQDRAEPSGSTTTAPAMRTIYNDAGRVNFVKHYHSLEVSLLTDSTYQNYHATTPTQHRLSVGTAGSNFEVSRTEYDAAGRVQYVVKANKTTNKGFLTEYVYDKAGRQTAVKVYYNTTYELDSSPITPGGAVYYLTGYEYDANGNQTRMTNNLQFVTEFKYDAQNRRTETIFPVTGHDEHAAPNRQVTVYDTLGRRSQEIDELGVITAFGYDRLDRLTSVTNAWKPSYATNEPVYVTAYVYDEAGFQIEQIDALNHTNRYETDAMGRRLFRILPMGQKEGFGYDVLGSQTAYTNFNSTILRFEYDTMQRITNKYALVSGVSNNLAHYQYSAKGLLTNRVDTSGTYQWVYDVSDRVKTNVQPAGTIYYTYDVAGNLTTMHTSKSIGFSATYSWDILNRLASVKDTRSSPYGFSPVNYTYDSVGNLQTMTYPTTTAVEHKWEYDQRNRLTNLVMSANSAGLATYAYELNAVGQRTNLTSFVTEHIVQRWAYDGLRRMTNEHTVRSSEKLDIQHRYDQVGNRTNRNAWPTAGFPIHDSAYPVGTITEVNRTYDANDRMSGDSYDAAGNTTTADSLVHQYDYANRLTNYNAGQVVFTYDDAGNLVKRVGTHTRTYLIDGINPTGYTQILEEKNAAMDLSVVYDYGHDLVSQRRYVNGTGWVRHWYGYDGHGSVRTLLDSSGTITDEYTYDAYGKQILNSGSTVNPYRYTGEYYDDVVKVYRLRARMFDPERARFRTMDSYEGRHQDPLSLHKYLYCRADPANRVDPSGHADYNASSLLSALGIQDILQGVKSLREAAVNQAVRQFGRDMAEMMTFSDKNENKQIAMVAERLWEMRLKLLGLDVVNLGQGVGKHGPDMIAFGWQGNRFRLIIGEVKGTRRSRVLSLLDKTQDGVMQMSSKWLSEFSGEMGDSLAKYMGTAIGPALGEGIQSALESGRLDLYLLRAKDMRNSSWELRGYRLIGVGDSSVGRAGTSGVDDIEAPQIIAHPSF